MKQLFNRKKAMRAACFVFAGVVVGTSALAMSSCTSSHPEAEITIEFNSNTYELKYKLYRNMAPATVQHFIELADNRYYDNTCINNYTSSYYYGGSYEFNENDVGNGYGGLEYKDYFSIVQSFNLTQSVFDTATGVGTNTVYGEFTNNGVTVQNNALTHKYGSLAMYYNNNSTNTTKVKTVRSSDSSKTDIKDYKYNCATSDFYIFTGTSSTANDAKYCVFGVIQNEDVLDSLKDAIADYIDEQGDDYSFIEAYKVQINTNDPYADQDRVTFNVPKEPIIIKTVEITKY